MKDLRKDILLKKLETKENRFLPEGERRLELYSKAVSFGFKIPFHLGNNLYELERQLNAMALERRPEENKESDDC